VSGPTLDFLRTLLLRRGAATSLTDAESRLLVTLARGRRSLVEVGVFQGATSARLAAAMSPTGSLWLVDPYDRRLRLERLLGLSYNEHIARRTLRPWSGRVHWLRRASTVAAREIDLAWPAELIFVDADHSDAAVRDDFLAWSPHLAPAGILAFHDSRRCPARPDLDATTGPVRLVEEILRGEHGSWSLCAEADSIAAFQRGPASPSVAPGATGHGLPRRGPDARTGDR
jgi:predicted O-methyltransferase YrrM